MSAGTGVRAPRRGAPSRRGVLAGLSGAGLLAACGGPPPPAVMRAPRDAGAPLAELDTGQPHLIIGGERVDATLVRDFYARHGFRPVWTSRPGQAEALAETVLRAGEHGLDPELFLGSLLRRRDGFSPLRRDVLISHAVLTYAEALAYGAVRGDRRKDVEALAPGPVNLPATLDAALDAGDPAAVIEALAPDTATYRLLRAELKRPQRPPAPPRAAGRRGNAAAQAAAAAAQRARQVLVNLERERWLPRPLPADRVWVNIADQRVQLFRGEEEVFASRVVVGEETPRKQSPEFSATIEAGFFNPPWVIPRDIVQADIIPRAERDPTYLARHNIVLLADGQAEQQPGPEAGLGLLMLDMPNRFDVYLHDTPDKQLFGRENRRASNGCIRVENVLEFAARLWDRPIEAINDKLAGGATRRSALPTPMAVFLTYQTAFAGANGRLEFRQDFYGRDADLARALTRA
jgi:murein L,D-transpeptidase YcbB/YkuD